MAIPEECFKYMWVTSIIEAKLWVLLLFGLFVVVLIFSPKIIKSLGYEIRKEAKK